MEQNYDIIKEITEDFVFQTYGNGNPDGFSFSLCYSLSVLFTLMEIKHEITLGNSPKNNNVFSHFWITLDKEETILDPTIQQFNLNEPKVYLGNRLNNRITKKYQINKRNWDDEFAQMYHSWIDLLLQHEDRMPRTLDFEKRLINLNLDTAQVLLTYIKKFRLIDKLKTSDYGLNYFRPFNTINLE